MKTNLTTQLNGYFKISLLAIFILSAPKEYYSQCTNLLACNYDPDATVDDGSCAFPGCLDFTAYNYDVNAGCNNSNCSYTVSPCEDEILVDGSRYDFSGYYSPFNNWNYETNGGDGEFYHSINTLMIRGNDNVAGGALTQTSLNVELDGTYSFDWEFNTLDSPTYEIAYYINNTQVILTDNAGGLAQSGSISIELNAGDILGFGINDTDGIDAPSYLLITNFKHPLKPGCGCTDPQATNYDDTKTINNGSCNYHFGCLDEEACNYDPTAASNNDNCFYDYNTCFGNCINSDGNGVGFYGPFSSGSWINSLSGNTASIVTYPNTKVIKGSYFGQAGSTESALSAPYTGTYTFDWSFFTEDDPNWEAAYYLNGTEVLLTNPVGELSQNGSVSFFANAGDVIGFAVESVDGYIQPSTLVISNFTWETDDSVCGCMDIWACNYNPAATNHDPLLCQLSYGCDDPTACNYYGETVCPSEGDGLCVYEIDECNAECLDPDGNGVDFISDYDSSNWTQEFQGGNGIIDHGIGSLLIVGSTNQSGDTRTTIEIPKSGNISFEWCYFTEDISANWDPVYYINGSQFQLSDNTGSLAQSGEVSIEVEEGDTFGFNVFSDGFLGTSELVIANFKHPLAGCGCTDPWACNYDSEATFHNQGSCDYNFGCLDSFACNYNSSASCDDGSCVYNYGCNSDCQNDEGNSVGFVQYYNQWAWNYVNGDGGGFSSMTPSSLHIEGGTGFSLDTTSVSIPVQKSGTITFDWCYFTEDGPNWDPAYYINGEYFEITDPGGNQVQNGSVLIDVDQGDIFGFAVVSTDGIAANGSVTITNFSYPSLECGCGNPCAANYDPLAEEFNNNLCDYNYGCTDPIACNYDEFAVEDGTCSYEQNSCTDDCINAEGQGVGFKTSYQHSSWNFSGIGSGSSTFSCYDGALHISAESAGIPLGQTANSQAGGGGSLYTVMVDQAAQQTGTYSFDWCYYSEFIGSDINPALYINGSPVELTDGSGSIFQTGSIEFTANAGDLIGFHVNSNDFFGSEVSLLITNFTYPVQECSCCIGDADGNYVVNVTDLLSVSSNFGCTVGCTFGDANCDGMVNVTDLLSISSNFGNSCLID